jgi:hypothetical protein
MSITNYCEGVVDTISDFHTASRIKPDVRAAETSDVLGMASKDWHSCGHVGQKLLRKLLLPWHSAVQEGDSCASAPHDLGLPAIDHGGHSSPCTFSFTVHCGLGP